MLRFTLETAAAEEKLSPGTPRAGPGSVDGQYFLSCGRGHEILHKPLLHPAGKEDKNKLEGFCTQKQEGWEAD